MVPARPPLDKTPSYTRDTHSLYQLTTDCAGLEQICDDDEDNDDDMVIIINDSSPEWIRVTIYLSLNSAGSNGLLR